MRMRPLNAGLEIKPGQTVELRPGGYHVMFMDLKRQLKQGETVKATLTVREGRHASRSPSASAPSAARRRRITITDTYAPANPMAARTDRAAVRYRHSRSIDYLPIACANASPSFRPSSIGGANAVGIGDVELADADLRGRLRVGAPGDRRDPLVDARQQHQRAAACRFDRLQAARPARCRPARRRMRDGPATSVTGMNGGTPLDAISASRSGSASRISRTRTNSDW